MMRGTPRTFVGPVVFLLDGPVHALVVERLRVGLLRLPGIGSLDVDTAGGTLVVTAVAPTDRTEVVGVLDRVGCRVRG
jgi:hypothetical protein